MIKPRMASSDLELITAAPVLKGSPLVVGPTGVAPPDATVPLDGGAEDPVEPPVARTMEDDLVDEGAEDSDDLLVAEIMEADIVLDEQYVVVYDVV